jgi:iduronate 2-sulfatase
MMRFEIRNLKFVTTTFATRWLQVRRCLLSAAMVVALAPPTTRGVHSSAAHSQLQSKPSRKLNVLMIAVDDLRPEAGCYGVPLIRTPNIDALARRGTVFTQAYCQQAVCSPSRTSLLTGRRPDTTKIYELQTHFRATIPDVVTLPEHFKNHGYHAQGFSKIYHGGLDDPASWSVPHWTPKQPRYGKPETLADLQRRREQARAEGRLPAQAAAERDPKTGAVLMIPRPNNPVRGPSWEDPVVADSALPDGETADKAIETLRAVKDKPFFLAVGFLNPHLPFVAPKKYFDYYPLDRMPLAPNSFPPKDAPPLALTNSGELRNYLDIPKEGQIPDAKARELLRGYYAATSYTDAQIGRILDELDRLGLRENTIVVLWGDHGWQLGEHGLWNKHTNFEVATRSLLVVSAPGQKKVNAKTDGLTEFVDIYPSLCELAGLPLPSGLEGASFVRLLDDPKQSFKQAAFSQYPRPGQQAMGYTMRTPRYRYTEWLREGRLVIARELYDHLSDPRENVNISDRPEHKELVAKLSAQLQGGWRAALPVQPVNRAKGVPNR